MCEAIIGLVGVVVGFALSCGWDEWRAWRQKVRARQCVRGELQLNLAMIPGKRAILLFAQEQLRKEELSPTTTIRFSTVFHDQHLDTIYTDLTPIQAHSLHFIRDHMRIIDDAMETLLDRAKADLQLRSPQEVISLYFRLVGDLIMCMARLEEMLTKHLSGQPVLVIPRT